MTQQSSPELAAAHWYGQPGVIRHWFHGVFEGGGAKGIAYSGALLAMAERACWFRAVAGASVGAITAALVASGLTPNEIEAQTDHALKLFPTSRWAGLRRLQSSTGYFSSADLRNWLDDLLKTQIGRTTGKKPGTPVTFLELHTATQIELNVVAADLSMRCHVVFSHMETPDCAVADAVVASSSIPFGFPSCLLRVQEGDQSASYHTIVDGGVWSNFPMYVFEDEAFRRSYEREPTAIDPKRVLGFLLDEGEQAELPRGVRSGSSSMFQQRTFARKNGRPHPGPLVTPHPQ
jgi:predicted acylesterase/phospholipase RssA